MFKEKRCVGTNAIKCLWCIIKRAYILQNYIESWNERLAALKMLNNAIKQKLTTCYHNGYPFIFFLVTVHKLLSYKIILHYSIFLHTCFTNNLVIISSDIFAQKTSCITKNKLCYLSCIFTSP